MKASEATGRSAHKTHALPGAVLPGPCRRVAQGIEITSQEMRLVRLSCAAMPEDDDVTALWPSIQVDDVVCQSLPAGTVVGADIVDPEALSVALSTLLARQAARLAERGVSPHDAMAMALCPSVVVQAEVSLDELMPGFRMSVPARCDDRVFDALEPWVMLHAQKISGIDFNDLIVDWYRPVPSSGERIVIAAAQRHYLQVRQELVGAAGGRLCALADAATAVLGAARFVVARSLQIVPEETGADAFYPAPVKGARFRPRTVIAELDETPEGTDEALEDVGDGASSQRFISRIPPRRVFRAADGAQQYACGPAAMNADGRHIDTPRFAVIWVGEMAWRAWVFEADGTGQVSLPLPRAGSAHQLTDALRLAAPGPLTLAIVAGERALLAPAGGITAIGLALACPAIEFDASACCAGTSATPDPLNAGTSVAFGLALQELMR